MSDDLPECICINGFETQCANPVCPRQLEIQREVGVPCRRRWEPVRGFWRDFERNRRILHGEFPAAFPTSGQPRRALANGIHVALEASGALPRAQVRLFLRAWTTQPSYRAAVAAGGLRINLDGSDAMPITENEVHSAKVQIERAMRRKAEAARDAA